MNPVLQLFLVVTVAIMMEHLGILGHMVYGGVQLSIVSIAAIIEVWAILAMG